jgi:hypothetical protein
MTIYACFKPVFKVFQVFSDACFKYFYLNVSYIAMAAHAYFKCLFSCVSDVLDILLKWIRMLHMLLYTHISRVCFKCFSCML